MLAYASPLSQYDPMWQAQFGLRRLFNVPEAVGQKASDDLRAKVCELLEKLCNMLRFVMVHVLDVCVFILNHTIERIIHGLCMQEKCAYMAYIVIIDYT